MKTLIILALTISSMTSFAGQKCERIAAKKAQTALNVFLNDKSVVFKGATIDSSYKPYIFVNEDGSTQFNFEARLKHVEPRYNSPVNDMGVAIVMSNRCQVKSVQVYEISAE